MITYYCDDHVCYFLHHTWCSYWDSSIDLMKRRNKTCLMDDKLFEKLDKLLDGMIG